MRNRPEDLGVTVDVKRCLAVLAMVICEAGCGSVPVTVSTNAPVDATTTITSTTTVAVPTVVPWVDRPAPPFVPPPDPVVTFPTDARPCQAADLEISAGAGGGGMGNALIQFLFTNRSTSACVLDGYPTVTGVLTSGDVRELMAVEGTYFGDPGPPANIAPGEVAAVNLATAWPCKTEPTGQAKMFPILRLGLPGGDTIDVSGEGVDIYCGLWVSRFGVPALTVPPPPTIESPLTVSTTMPASVHRGEQLVYSVTLTNSSIARYPLDPCPSYTEAIAGSIRDYYLDCDTVSVIDVGQSVTFEMRITVPGDAEFGEGIKFGWSLHSLGDPGVGGGVTVEA